MTLVCLTLGFTWFFSFAGTWIALLLLRRLHVMDTPNARSNHSAPVPRGGGIAMVVVALLFLFSAQLPPLMLAAAALLAIISFADDLKNLPVAIRLLAQIVAVCIAVPLLPWGLFPTSIPLVLGWVVAGLIWMWIINLTNFMDGIDGITSIQTILVCVGVRMVCEMAHTLPHDLALHAGIIAAATLGFYWFNRSPAKVFMGDVGSITLGFLTGYLLLRLALSGAVIPALILPAYYVSDATFTLLKRLMRGEKVWQAHSEHAYQQAVRAGMSHRLVVCRICGLNVVLVVLAMCATVSMMTAIAMLLIAYGLTACLIRHFTHASPPR